MKHGTTINVLEKFVVKESEPLNVSLIPLLWQISRLPNLFRPVLRWYRYVVGDNFWLTADLFRTGLVVWYRLPAPRTKTTPKLYVL